ncbi:hypothetical protein PIB30_084611 [Stylosanthes scabra]|uniref:Uncharacterized protein n=1 Tax=Stylosanthes scabra TaxID=79078 RepID=A0ABU6ZR75_9FABA|nr:hypothetical protein [Stylosanthes scabra]
MAAIVFGKVGEEPQTASPRVRSADPDLEIPDLRGKVESEKKMAVAAVGDGKGVDDFGGGRCENWLCQVIGRQGR